MYYDEMAPGTIRYIDEIKFDNDIKEAWTYFQTGAPKSVTEKIEDKFVAINVTSSKRITYWGSTVDFGADEQIRNRFLQIEVNADAETLAKIHAHNNKKLTGKYQTPVEDKVETEICRAIMKALGPMEYNVIIPFAERTNFGGTDPRTATMFRDAICASSVWNYANRAKDGYGRLEAAEEDFYQALEMFNLIGGQSADKFTDAEKRILNAIINSKNRNASSVEIQRSIGMNGPRFNQVIYGRSNKNEQQKYGLASKCTELIINNEKKPYNFELPSSFILKSGMQVKLMEENKRHV